MPATPFFLPTAGGQRFCLLHTSGQAPEEPVASILYIHPFAEELNRSRRMVALQCQSLAAAGFEVLQMDLGDCGDSSGHFADATWEGWVADVLAAREWLLANQQKRSTDTPAGTGACRYANAGHPPALLADHDQTIHELDPTGPLLGVFPASWKTANAEMGAGAKLAVYTDGLTEARDDAEVFYGMERLAELIATLPCEVAESVVKTCFDDLHVFRPSRLADDVTVVLVCRECEVS